MADIKDKLKKLFSKKEESVGEKAGEAVAKAGLKAMAEKLKGKEVEHEEIKNNMTHPKEFTPKIHEPIKVNLPNFDLTKTPTIQDKFEKYKGTNRGVVPELEEKDVIKIYKMKDGTLVKKQNGKVISTSKE